MVLLAGMPIVGLVFAAMAVAAVAPRLPLLMFADPGFGQFPAHHSCPSECWKAATHVPLGNSARLGLVPGIIAARVSVGPSPVVHRSWLAPCHTTWKNPAPGAAARPATTALVPSAMVTPAPRPPTLFNSSPLLPQVRPG